MLSLMIVNDDDDDDDDGGGGASNDLKKRCMDGWMDVSMFLSLSLLFSLFSCLPSNKSSYLPECRTVSFLFLSSSSVLIWSSLRRTPRLWRPSLPLLLPTSSAFSFSKRSAYPAFVSVPSEAENSELLSLTWHP